MRSYTDIERAQALAVLDANHGNVARTARETQIPRSTIHLWRDEARAVTDIVPLHGTDWHAVREEAGQLFLDLAVEAAQIVRANLANFHGRILSPAETQRIATVAGIAADKGHRFLTEPSSLDVNVDARSIHLGGLEALPAEALQELVEALSERAADGPDAADGIGRPGDHRPL
jgi:transposase-like protein